MPFPQHTPNLSGTIARQVVAEFYGLKATSAAPLPGERDQNFLINTAYPNSVESGAGSRFVLKIASATEALSVLEAENAAMAHLATRTTICPRVVPTAKGEDIAKLGQEFGGNFVRLVQWMPGVTLGSVPHISTTLLRRLGYELGQVDVALQSFDHPAIHRDLHWDLANGIRVVREFGPLVTDSSLRATVDALTSDFERHDAALFSNLRRSAIHNDANDHNVLVGDDDGADLYTRHERIVGLIDFGDMVYSATVADLAIAVAYAVLDSAEPLHSAAAIVRGYHDALALHEDEIACLFGMVRLRLCMSVVVAQYQRQHRPHDEYLVISQDRIAAALPKLATIPRRFAEAYFRNACGLLPTPTGNRVTSWLTSKRKPFTPLVDLPVLSPAILDLSVSSPLIAGDHRENTESRLTPRIMEVMTGGGATVGIGRYGEPRIVYTSTAFAGDRDSSERRTVHMGVDLFVPAGTPIRAAFDGVVYAFNDNAAPLDYGPVIILRHETEVGDKFFTLYGHLSRNALDNLYSGKMITAGDRFATIGTASVNGGWPPHLHFQLIVDLLDLDCDFPGVGRASEWEVWSSLSPDPSAIVGMPSSWSPSVPGKGATLEARRQRTGRNLTVAYRDPLKLSRGWMEYVYDETGRQYLDAFNNVPHVGHCHPRVVSAASDAMRTLNTNTRYLHDALVRYAERLASTLPKQLSVCYFVNSGSEANELALRMVRSHTRRRGLIVLESAYHGNTTTLISISPYKFNGPGGDGAPPWLRVVPVPDTYRGPFKSDDAQAGAKYAAFVQAAVDALIDSGDGLTGFIAESAPSVAGQIVLPPNYLEQVYRIVRSAGGLCIADEVQTAFGRLGTHFYGFESQGVVPDVVVLGKPIGNGHPIGAVVTTPDVAASFDGGMEFFSTFGGNTVSCAIGCAVMDVVEEQHLQEHAMAVGARLMDSLATLHHKHAVVGDVRGSGFFIGVEFVRSRDTLAPAPEEASYVVNRLRESGILVGTDGPYHNVLKIRPPMPFSDSDADRLAHTLHRIVRECEAVKR